MTPFTTPKSLLGIDITPSHITLIQCQKQKHEYHLHYFASKEIRAHLFHDGRIEDWDLLKSMLLPMLIPIKKASPVAINLSSQLVRMQKIILPYGLSQAQIEDEIYQTMQRDLPGVDYHLCIDYVMLPREEPGYIDLYFIAARREYITNYIDCLKQLGLQTKIIDVDIYALKRSLASILPKLYDAKDTHAILYFSSHIVFLFVYNAQGIILHHQFFDQNILNKNVFQMKTWIDELYQTVQNKLSNHMTIIVNPNCRNKIIHQHDEWLDQNKIIMSFSPSLSDLVQSPKTYQAILHDYSVALGLTMREVPLW